MEPIGLLNWERLLYARGFIGRKTKHQEVRTQFFVGSNITKISMPTNDGWEEEKSSSGNKFSFSVKNKLADSNQWASHNGVVDPTDERDINDLSRESALYIDHYSNVQSEWCLKF